MKSRPITQASKSGRTRAAGDEVQDQDFARSVAAQTSADMKVAPLFRRERDGVATDVAACDAPADALRS